MEVSRYTRSCTTTDLFLVPFDVNADTDLVEFQMEITDMQCYTHLRNAFQYDPLLDVYNHQLPAGNSPVLNDQVL
jgi:hypothetical protein